MTSASIGSPAAFAAEMWETTAALLPCTTISFGTFWKRE